MFKNNTELINSTDNIWSTPDARTWAMGQAQ